MLFCIPKNLVEKLKNSALKGEVDIKKIYEMSSQDRRNYFTEFTNAELGTFLNTKFEEAMASKQKNALLDWAKSTFDPKTKEKPVYKNILDKINTLDELGVLSPKSEQAFLQDLVADKLGINVSAEEVQAIATRAQKINEAQQKLGDDIGDPSKAEENLAFFKAKKEMDDYLSSLNPSSRLKVATGTIGRGMMLASVKSPILNIGSNIEIGLVEALGRRLSSLQIKGSNNQLAKDYVGFVNKIYKETGYDISRMQKLSDSGASGSRVLDDVVTTQGKGAVRKVGRLVEDIVFKNLMGAPDTLFSSVHFADSANLHSFRIAKGNKEKGTKIMQDAMRLEPKTAEGEIVRAQAIMDAEVATWTNTSHASKITTGIRKLINEASGDLRLGDQFLPFIKTPANVVETGLDYAGMGIPKALIKTVNIFRNAKKTNTKVSEEMKNPEYLRGIARDLTRAGLGMVGAWIIANLLDDDDYVGAYDPKRQQIEELRNSTENSIRIGNKWVSTDWLGPLSVGVNSLMYARKYGKGGFADSSVKYATGAGSTLLTLPGVSDIVDTLKDYNNNNGIFGDTADKIDSASSWVFSRIYPSILSDVAKMTDEFERKTGKGVAKIQAKIPYLRNKLPVKRDILGEEIKTEPWISTLFFGSRVKTSKDSVILDELSTIQKATNKSLNFTNWDKTTSSSIKQFKDEHNDVDWEGAKSRYGFQVKQRVDELMKSEKYKNYSDEEKLKALNNVDSEAIDKVFKQFAWKYKKN